MTSLSISLLLPISGIVVSAVLVAVSRKKKRDATSTGAGKPAEIDISWLDEYEKAEKSRKAKPQKAKKPQKKKEQVKPVLSADEPVSQESVKESEVESDGLDDIQLLAAMQKRAFLKKASKPTVKAVSAPIAVVSAPAPVADGPVTDAPVQVAEQIETVPEEDEAGWDRVPTKDELIISGLKDKVAALTKSLEQAEQAKAVAEKNLSLVQEKALRTEAEMKEKTVMFINQSSGLERELNSFRSHAQLLSKRVIQLEESELAETKEDIQRLTSELLAAESRVAELEAGRNEAAYKLDCAQRDASASSEEMAKLKATLESLSQFKAKYTGLEAEFAKVKQALYETESDLIILKSLEASRSAEHKKVLEAKDSEVVSLLAKVNELSQRLEGAETVSYGQIDYLKGELVASQKGLEVLKAEYGKLVAEHEAALKQIATQNESRVAELEAKLSGLEKEKAALECSSANAIGNLDAMKAAKAELEAKYTAEVERTSALEAELESVRAKEVEDKTDQVEGLKTELEAVKKRFAEYLTSNAGLKSRKEELEVENFHMFQELNQLKAAIFGSLQAPKKPVTTVPAQKVTKRDVSPAPSVNEESPSGR